MAVCANCGTSNIDGTKFCVSCGGQLGDAPAPESWRASSELNPPTADAGGSATGGYAPQVPPTAPTNYPTYNPPQSPQGYGSQGAGGAQPIHPAIPAIVSLFLPGIGLLFVPDKQKLGIMIFAGYVLLGIIGTVLSLVLIGICVFLLMPLVNIAAAIHSWDEAAKVSGGQFQPLLFK